VRCRYRRGGVRERGDRRSGVLRGEQGRGLTDFLSGSTRPDGGPARAGRKAARPPPRDAHDREFITHALTARLLRLSRA
jgi:hypothetical protein